MGCLENEIRITCLGDLLASDTDYSTGTGISSKMGNLLEYYGQHENNLFNGSDIVICNLESPLITDISVHQLPFAGNPSIVGKEGFQQTISLLSDNNIKYTGSMEDSVSRIVFLEFRNKKIALAGFNAIPDHPDNTFIAPLERDILFNTLNEIKKQSPDYIVYSFHWGNEYVSWPSPEQVDLAHELIDNGVNIIIGHHPHVVQPVEKYNGGVIMYSLGNFLFDMFWSETVRNGIQVDLFLNNDKSINYTLKHFRIRTDFTHDYINTDAGVSIYEKSNRKFEQLLEGPRQLYERAYHSECKRRRLMARLNMKLFLIRNLFNLSRVSRGILLENLKKKSIHFWTRN